MAKIELDKYFTEDDLAKYCIDKTFETIGDDWDRIIEPSAGGGSFLQYLPKDTISYDIEPVLPQTIQADYREVQLDYMDKSLVIGNPPFGQANKLSVQFIKQSLTHSPYIAFIQPISQLNQNRTMKDTELLYSEDLGKQKYSNREVHCCFNIYHYCKDGHKDNFDIPGIIECRHIFRSGKYKHKDEILNDNWDFRVAAWGSIRLLEEDEQCPNEVVFKIKEDIKDWLYTKLKNCNYQKVINSVTTPNLPAWRLKKWLREEYVKDFSVDK